jgi:predicted transcriptional regulator
MFFHRGAPPLDMDLRLGQGQAEQSQTKAPLRMQMYDYIQRHPAAHILEMAEAFHLTHPTVMYHLAVLDDEGYILSTIWGKRRVHFDTQGHFTVWEREILAILALDEARSILEHVATHPGTFPREIARELRISETTVKRYIPELLRLHVLQEEEGSFRRRLRVSRSFKKRGLALLEKMPADARPGPYLEAVVKNDEP